MNIYLLFYCIDWSQGTVEIKTSSRFSYRSLNCGKKDNLHYIHNNIENRVQTWESNLFWTVIRSVLFWYISSALLRVRSVRFCTVVCSALFWSVTRSDPTFLGQIRIRSESGSFVSIFIWSAFRLRSNFFRALIRSESGITSSPIRSEPTLISLFLKETQIH